MSETLENSAGAIRFADLSDEPDPRVLPWLDRPGIRSNRLNPDQLAWYQDGVVIKRRFIPDIIADAYIARREQLDEPGGWLVPTPYLQVDELRELALYPPLMRLMADLIGEPMLLHLALTGWISTERNWHQDDYLNPGFVNSWYCAVWIALGRIESDCGPFEYVPGSHRWPLLRGDKVKAFLTEEERNRRNTPSASSCLRSRPRSRREIRRQRRSSPKKATSCSGTAASCIADPLPSCPAKNGGRSSPTTPA
jgi:hypothetical protein